MVANLTPHKLLLIAHGSHLAIPTQKEDMAWT